MKISHNGNVVVWGGDQTIEFDRHTNERLCGDVSINPSSYSIVDGVLTRDGAPVAINDWCDDCKTLDSLDNATTFTQLQKALILMRDKPGFTRG